MRQWVWSKIFWSMGFWVVLVGIGAMLTGWPAGVDPARGVPGFSSEVGASGEMSAGQARQGLISYVRTSENASTSVILIDPAQQVMGVYHIDRNSGEIKLMSVRKFSWDLGMSDYNTSSPLPEEIHKGLQRQ